MKVKLFRANYIFNNNDHLINYQSLIWWCIVSATWDRPELQYENDGEQEIVGISRNYWHIYPTMWTCASS